MYIYEYDDDIVILDCGIGFADEDMPGVDFLIPDISYLLDKKQKVRGILHTHGHDDHIGALPYIWPELKCPIYASRITCGFIKTKLAEHELPTDQLVEINPDEPLQLGAFNFQFFRLSHSIPDTIGFVIDTPVGRVIHSADFKFDWTPVIGAPTDVQRIAQLSAEGVLLLLSDSLGAEKPGYTLSEQVIRSQFESVAQKTLGKMMITTTSSNISRIQMALDIAAKYNRKVAVSGRSMDQNIGVARNMGYLKFSDENYVSLEDIGKYEDQELLLIVAGSQGQSEAALSRVARDEHKHIKLRPGDSVIFSTDPIPGNENQTNRLIDQLIARGAEVYYSNIFSNIHVSGHAAQEELKLMLGLVKAKYLLPIGGTERSTKKYGDMAQAMGYSKGQILITHNGDIIEFTAQKDQVVTPKIVGKIETKDVMVDGLGIGDLSEVVMHDRQTMAEEGMLVVIVPVDHQTGKIQSGVEIVSRGFVYMKESSEFINDIARLVDDILDEGHGEKQDWNMMKKKIEDRVSKYIYKEIKRNPLVLPVVFEV
jgi:ribonuclease J